MKPLLKLPRQAEAGGTYLDIRGYETYKNKCLEASVTRTYNAVYQQKGIENDKK